MSHRGIAERRGDRRVLDLHKSQEPNGKTETYHSPTSSRSSENLYHKSGRSIEDWRYPARSTESGLLPAADLVEQYGHYNNTRAWNDHTIAESRSKERVNETETDANQHNRQRSRDDYGIAYSCYQNDDDDAFSLPDSPKDERHSLEWDSTFDPFTSASFRRGSLVLDPAAFESTSSVPLTPESPGRSATIRLRKSADALKEFGRKILPQLRLKTQIEDNHSAHATSSRDSHRRTSYKASSPSSTGCTTSPARTRSRSDTLESTRSSQSLRSKRSSTNLAPPESMHTRELLDSFWDLKSPLSTYMSTSSLGYPLPGHITREDLIEASKLPSTPPVASPFIASGSLATLPEQDAAGPAVIAQDLSKIQSPYGGTDPGLEEIMRQMQEEDEAFASTEENMRTSGWLTENDINDLRRRRNEQGNLWQRRLEDALDQVKAETSLD